MSIKKIILPAAIAAVLGLGVAGWLYWGQPMLMGENTPTTLDNPSQFKVEVQSAGFYTLNPKTLRDQGIIIDDWRPEGVTVQSFGNPVPTYISGDSVLFYAQESESIYSAVRPYLVQIDGSETHQNPIGSQSFEGNQGSTSDKILKKERLEENLVYSSIAYDEAFQDTWYWATIHVQKMFAINKILTDVGDGSGRIRVHLYGQSHDPATEIDHDLDLVINGQLIQTIRWEGPTHFVAEIDLPAGTLINGDNEIMFDNRPEGAVFVDIMLLDWVDLSYDAQATALDDTLAFAAEPGQTYEISGLTASPLVFDVSTPQAPELLSSARFQDGVLEVEVADASDLIVMGPAAPSMPFKATNITPSDLMENQAQTDLIVIATAEMSAGMTEYIAHRTEQGVSSRLVTAEEIYDHFGHGDQSPESISGVSHPRL